MTLFDKDLTTMRCGLDLLFPSTALFENRFLRQSDSFITAAPAMLKIPLKSTAHGTRALDTLTFNNFSDPYLKSASDTDSGTATTTTVTESFAQPHVNKQKSLYKVHPLHCSVLDVCLDGALPLLGRKGSMSVCQ